MSKKKKRKTKSDIIKEQEKRIDDLSIAVRLYQEINYKERIANALEMINLNLQRIADKYENDLK